MEEFLPVSDDIMLFFYLNEGNRTLITERYLDPYKEEVCTGKFNLKVILDALSDYDQVIDNVIRFYFRDIEEEKLMECRQSITRLHRLIKESKYNNDIKSALYSFFIEPAPMIQKLMYELMSKEILLAQKYEKGYKEILAVQECFDYEQFVADIVKLDRHPLDCEKFDNIYISFCYLFKNNLLAQFYNNALCFVMGTSYAEFMKSLSNVKQSLELDVFGTAVSEKNRVEILNLMMRMGEVTIKDLEQELGFTGTNAYYHLMLMMKADMLKTRNQGRTVFYRVDKEYFEKLINVLKKYTK